MLEFIKKHWLVIGLILVVLLLLAANCKNCNQQAFNAKLKSPSPIPPANVQTDKGEIGNVGNGD